MALVASVGLVAGGGVAYAAIPDPDGVIPACYKKGGLLQERGALRVTEDGRCRSNEVELSWNQVGPIGPVGPAGAAGAKGDQGPQEAPGAKGEKGDPGPTDGYAAHGRIDLLPGTSATVVTLSLPAGDYLVTGSAQLWNLDINARVGSCQLDGGDLWQTFLNRVWQPGDRELLTMQEPRKLTQPGTVMLSCENEGPARATADLTAVKVGAVHG